MHALIEKQKQKALHRKPTLKEGHAILSILSLPLVRLFIINKIYMMVKSGRAMV
jgi:hypothetical protein